MSWDASTTTAEIEDPTGKRDRQARENAPILRYIKNMNKRCLDSQRIYNGRE